MKYGMMLACVVFAASPSHAALSGYYDSAEQITTILSSDVVADALLQRPITSIVNWGDRKDGVQVWTVKSHGCNIKVYLTPVAPDGVGKTTYTLAVPHPCT